MKKYRKPIIKTVEFKDELLDMNMKLGSNEGKNTSPSDPAIATTIINGIDYSGGFAKQGSYVTGDEYLNSDVSYSKDGSSEVEMSIW